MLLAAFARLIPKERWSCFIVSPQTILRWHRELVAHK
jgi:putative transposase